MTTAQFEVGKTYSCRSICDSECIFKITVLARTAKTITIVRSGKVKVERRGVSVYEDSEVCYAYGKYSMCPVFRASKQAA